MISSQRPWPLDHEAGPLRKYLLRSSEMVSIARVISASSGIIIIIIIIIIISALVPIRHLKTYHCEVWGREGAPSHILYFISK